MTPDQLLSKLDTISLRDLDAKERWETLEQIKSAHKASARKHAPSGLEMERRIRLLRYWQELVRLYAEDKQLGEPVVEVPPGTVTEETENDSEAWVRVRVLKGCVIRGVQLMVGHVIDLTSHDLEELLAQGVVEEVTELPEATDPAGISPVEVPKGETEPEEGSQGEPNPDEVLRDEAISPEPPPIEAASDKIQLEETLPQDSSQDAASPDHLITTPEVLEAVASVNDETKPSVEIEISAPVIDREQPTDHVEAKIIAAPVEETALEEESEPTEESEPDQAADTPEVRIMAESQSGETEESAARVVAEAAAFDGIFAVMDEAEYGPKAPDIAIAPTPAIVEPEFEEQVSPEPLQPPEPEFVDLPSFPFLPKKAQKAEPESEPEPKPFPKLVFKSEMKAEETAGNARPESAELKTQPESEPASEPDPQPVKAVAPAASEALPGPMAQAEGIIEDRSDRVDADDDDDDSVSAVSRSVTGLEMIPEETPSSEPEEPAIPLEEALARLERRPKLPPGYHNKRADELEREAAATSDPVFRKQLLESAEKFRKMALSSARMK